MPDRDATLEELLHESAALPPVELRRKYGFPEKINDILFHPTRLIPVVTGALPAGIVAHLSAVNTSSTEGNSAVATSVFMLGYLAGHLGRRNSLARRAVQRSAQTRWAVSLYNKFWEWPEATATAVGIGAFSFSSGYFFSSKTLDDFFANASLTGSALELSTLFGLTVGYATYGALSLASRVFHSHSLSAFTNTVSQSYHRILQHPAKAMAATKRLLFLPHSPKKESELFIHLGDLQFRQSADEGAQSYIASMRALQSEEPGIGYADWIPSLPTKTPLTQKAAFLGEAAKNLLRGKFSLADRLIRLVVEDKPLRRIPRRAHAVLLKTLGFSAESDLEMRVYEELVHRDPSVRYVPVGESRNEVLIPESTEDMSSDIIFKRSADERTLFDEFFTTQLLRKRFGRRVSNPLSLTRRGDRYVFTFEIEGRTTQLERAEARQHNYSDFAKIVDLMADMQAFLLRAEQDGQIIIPNLVTAQTYRTIDGTVIPNQDKAGTRYFTNRLLDVFLGQVRRYTHPDALAPLDSAIIVASPVFDRALSQLPSLPYADFNQKNLINERFLSKIDNEQIRNLTWPLDIVNATEFSHRTLTQRQLSKLLKRHSRRFPRALRHENVSHPFTSHISPFAVHLAYAQRHFELVGYRARDSVHSQDALRDEVFHYQSAASQLEKAIAHCTDVAERETLSRLSKALATTSILDQNLQQSIERVIAREDYFVPMERPPLAAQAALGFAALTLLASGTFGYVALRNNTLPFTEQPIFTLGSRFPAIIENKKVLPAGEATLFNEAASSPYSLVLFDAASGQQEHIAGLSVPFASLSPLENAIAFEEQDKAIVFDFRNNARHQLGETERQDFPIVSPSGLLVATTFTEPFRTQDSSFVYIFETDGLGKRASFERANAFSPVWSPDSKSIAFLSYGRDASGFPDTSAVSVNVSNVTLDPGSVSVWQGPPVGQDYGIMMAWSPDRKLAFTSYDADGRASLSIADFSSSSPEVRKIYELVPGEQFIYEAFWLSGSDILVNVLHNSDFSQHLLRIDASTGTSNRIAGGTKPVLSPDGASVLFSSARDLASYSVESGAISRLTTTPDITEPDFFYSRDGTSVFFTTFANKISNISVMNADGSSARKITENTDEAIRYRLVSR
jgi:Tol biopolymer transport system component